jgi:hypothetical protein
LQGKQAFLLWMSKVSNSIQLEYDIATSSYECSYSLQELSSPAAFLIILARHRAAMALDIRIRSDLLLIFI